MVLAERKVYVHLELCLLVSLFAAPIWPSQLSDYTGFSKQDLAPLSVLLYVKW